ncbi:MAG: acyltransferase [Verrucomicrobiota bacterium]
MNRSIPIDILRLAAVLLVMLRHLHLCSEQQSASGHAFASMLQCGGWIGVDLFFVLSGFLISSLLFSEHKKYGQISFKRFFIRRGFKIYPSFWLLIFVVVVVSYFQGQPVRWKLVAGELLFIQSYYDGIFAHSWSLAVEEHFYVFLPLLLIVCERYCRHRERIFSLVPWVYLALVVTCLVVRLVTVTFAEFNMTTVMFQSHVRMDSLFFGVVLSYYYHEYPAAFMEFARRHARRLILAGGVLLAPAFWLPQEDSFYIQTLGLAVFSWGSGSLLVGMMGLGLGASWWNRGLAFIGARSYSIYLWHMIAGHGLNRIILKWLGLTDNYPAYLVVYFCAAIGGGIFMAALVEWPMLYLRDRFFPSRSLPTLAGNRPADAPKSSN